MPAQGRALGPSRDVWPPVSTFESVAVGSPAHFNNLLQRRALKPTRTRICPFVRRGGTVTDSEIHLYMMIRRKIHPNLSDPQHPVQARPGFLFGPNLKALAHWQ
jgi:hypothetical protein